MSVIKAGVLMPVGMWMKTMHLNSLHTGNIESQFHRVHPLMPSNLCLILLSLYLQNIPMFRSLHLLFQIQLKMEKDITRSLRVWRQNTVYLDMEARSTEKYSLDTVLWVNLAFTLHSYASAKSNFLNKVKDK